MANDEHRTKMVFAADSAPTNRLAEALQKRSVPTQALASAMAKMPATPVAQAPVPQAQPQQAEK